MRPGEEEAERERRAIQEADKAAGIRRCAHPLLRHRHRGCFTILPSSLGAGDLLCDQHLEEAMRNEVGRYLVEATVTPGERALFARMEELKAADDEAYARRRGWLP